MPILAVSYMFQYLDKSALSLTAILGLREDLGVSGSQYSWANSVYYFGYLIASYPAAALMVRLPTGKTIAASMYVKSSAYYAWDVLGQIQNPFADERFLLLVSFGDAS